MLLSWQEPSFGWPLKAEGRWKMLTDVSYLTCNPCFFWSCAVLWLYLVLLLLLLQWYVVCLLSSDTMKRAQHALCPVTFRLDNLWNFVYVRTFMLIGISVLSIINNHTISVSLHAWWLGLPALIYWLWLPSSLHICAVLCCPCSLECWPTHTHTLSVTNTHFLMDPPAESLLMFGAIMTSVFLKSWLRHCAVCLHYLTRSPGWHVYLSICIWFYQQKPDSYTVALHGRALIHWNRSCVTIIDKNMM